MPETVQKSEKKRKRTTEEVVEWIHGYYTEISESRQGQTFDEILDIANDPRRYKKSKRPK